MRTRWAAALLIVTLAGCTESSPPTASAPSSATSDLPASPPVSPTPVAPSPAGPSSGATPPPPSDPGAANPGKFDGVQLVRSGGIAGITETTTIRTDGTWTRVPSKGAQATGRTDPATLGRLAELAADPRLAAEAVRKQPTRGNCADTYSYLLTVVGKRTIRYESCPGRDKPPATVEMISLVQDAAK
ncbi:hypothetical protein GCM10010172_73110 [Paractinoplanes ferrugineus]|uniref:Uncharacterized protein n=1 Tax=Paractinoplanes ferrugineus TaxID=113564 RepID=A0A919J0L8_9ACTN|nr:protealysin inhibitor emfourin [Actinoplanes ferrugineus]GIE11534.1 hypothetical protein Afe05nite_33740 [Actinoplanes ferrugineus]